MRIAVIAGAIAVTGAGCVLRLWQLDSQSYWLDEIWSVSAASLPFKDSMHTIESEVHPPPYQLFLWAWVQLGGTDAAWTRLPSALFGISGVLLSYWLLRATGLSLTLRLMLVSVTAASGAAIVYAQEARPYSALWCTAVAVTAMTLRMAPPSRTMPSRRTAAMWVVWGALASALHMFGAILVVASAISIAVTSRKRVGRLALLAGMAITPQVLWLAYGTIFVPGFASASGWITPPTLLDLGDLATSVAATGNLHFTERGFVWGSPWGVIVLAVVALSLVVLWRLPPRSAPEGSRPSREVWHPAQLLGILVTATVGIAYVGSQVAPVWTIRNMIVVLPAAGWCAVTVLLALATLLRATSVVAMIVILLLAADIVAISAAISVPYKPDTAETMRYLDSVRRQAPDTLLVGNFAPNWLLSSGLPEDAEFSERLFSPSIRSNTPSPLDVHARPVDTLYAYFVGDALETDNAVAEIVSQAGGKAACSPIPIFGMAVVRCDGD